MFGGYHPPQSPFKGGGFGSLFLDLHPFPSVPPLKGGRGMIFYPSFNNSFNISILKLMTCRPGRQLAQTPADLSFFVVIISLIL
jgi:hypothetical protein